jgi:hypothetical protein
MAGSAEDAQSLQWLTEEFGHEFGPQIFETVKTGYRELFPKINPKFRTASGIKDMVDNIILCIQPSIERAIATAITTGDEKVVGDIAYKAIIRKYYITLFLSKYYERVPGNPELKSELEKNIGRIRKKLFPILFQSLIDRYRSHTWLCDEIDKLIQEDKAGFPAPPRTIRDEAESARLAVIEVIGQRRMQEQMQSFDDQTMTLGMAAAPSEFPPLFTEEPLDEEEELRQDIREAILNVEKSGKIDLNDRSTHGSVFLEIFRIPPFNSMRNKPTPENEAKFDKIQQLFYPEMDLLLSERQGEPPSVVFSPGIPTSRQLARRSHAEQLGWKYGPLPRGAVALFPDPDKKGPDPDNKGGSKRIKSKKNSKMHSKNKRRSKRRSNTRRRHRNSYK